MISNTLNTIQLFNYDPYCIEFSAEVVDVFNMGVVLNKTLFYPLGGGQPGDTGIIKTPSGQVINIINTRRCDDNKNIIIHMIEDDYKLLSKGMLVKGTIDWDKRYQYMKIHSCLHLLRSIIHQPVTGCNISFEKGRLDFNMHNHSIKKENLTSSLNEMIDRGAQIEIYHGSLENIKSRFPQLDVQSLPINSTDDIRVVEIKGVDIEPCIGMHVKNIAEIGHISCDKISNKGKENIRISLSITKSFDADIT